LPEYFTIEKSVYGGYGLAFSKNHAFFVRNTLPGEVISLKPYVKKEHISFCTVDKIFTPSANRIKPQCESYPECGGCSYLETNYENEIHLKLSIIEDSLIRIAKCSDYPSIDIVSAERFNYRSIANIQLSNCTPGFFGHKSSNLVQFPTTGCLLLQKELAKSANNLHSNIDGSLKMACDFENKILRSDSQCTVTEQCSGFIFKHHINSFFQANRLLRDKMLNIVINLFNSLDTELAIDAGCGCGFFTIPVSKKAKHITGYDIDKESIKFARLNSKLNSSSNINFVRGDFDSIANLGESTVIADPPRAGLSKKFVSRIISENTPAIIYISCNPSTWARDTGILLSHHYCFKKIVFIDMFPGTHHIEIISLLVKV